METTSFSKWLFKNKNMQGMSEHDFWNHYIWCVGADIPFKFEEDISDYLVTFQHKTSVFCIYNANKTQIEITINLVRPHSALRFFKLDMKKNFSELGVTFLTFCRHQDYGYFDLKLKRQVYGLLNVMDQSFIREFKLPAQVAEKLLAGQKYDENK